MMEDSDVVSKTKSTIVTNKKSGNPHQTVFIPFHSSSSESPLDMECSSLTAQL